MSVNQSVTIRPGLAGLPQARPATLADIKHAIDLAVDDFRAVPGYAGVFGFVYAVVGIAILAVLWSQGHPELLFPVLSGFVLFGPFGALGLYEISRRRSRGLKVDGGIFYAFRGRDATQIALFGLTLTAMTILWLEVAAAIYAIYFGFARTDLEHLMVEVITTANGIEFAVVGITIGAVFAAIVFAISAFSLPLLLMYDIDVVTAILTSVKTVFANPLVMLVWAVVIAGLAAVGLATGLVGLIVALPLAGHASWHLAEKLFEAEAE